MKKRTLLRVVILLCIITMGTTYIVPHFHPGKNERSTASQAGGGGKDPSGEMIIWQLLYQHVFTFN